MADHLVFICLDSVRKDVFDEVAVRLRRLSDVSVSQCRAASSWSVPSHASMLTGRLPHEHGVHTFNRAFTDIPAAETLCTRLPDAYTSVGVSANVFAGPAFGFDTFFDEFVDPPRYQPFLDGLNAVEFFYASPQQGLPLYQRYLRASLAADHPIKSLLNGLSAQLQKFTMDRHLPTPFDDGATVMTRLATDRLRRASGPVFLFLNFMEAHTPFEYIWGMDRSLVTAPLSWSSSGEDIWAIQAHPDRYERHLTYRRALYAASVEYLDRAIAAFIEEVQRTVDRHTTFVITADHGENQGYPCEDFLVDHKASLSEGLLHVPFEIVGATDVHVSADEPFSHLAIPRLIESLATDTTPDLTTEPVAAELVGLGPGQRPPETDDRWDRALRCVYDPAGKVLFDSQGTVNRYEIDRDRPCWERVIPSLSLPRSDYDDRFPVSIAEYRSRVERTLDDLEVDDATAARLRELGYL